MPFVSADVVDQTLPNGQGKRQPADVEGVSAHDNFLAIIQGCTFYFVALVDFQVCYAETETRPAEHHFLFS